MPFFAASRRTTLAVLLFALVATSSCDRNCTNCDAGPTVPVNQTPVATELTATVAEDSSVDITLAGTDADGTIMDHAVATSPDNGTLTGTAPNLQYTPDADFNGADSFTFTVTDDAGTVSAPARVSIEVTPVNDAPVAMSQNVAVDEDGAVAIVLAGSDVDGDAVAYQITGAPRHGTLGGDEPSLIYMPKVDYNGPDSFTFTVTDDAGTVSAPARVSIEVTPVNDAPVAMSQSVAVDEDGAVAIVLAGSDVDGNTVAYQVTDNPRHGTLGGDAPSLTYMPEVDFNGSDSFTFTVTDDAGAVSAPARVSIEVTPVNDAPVAMSQSVAVDEDGTVAIVLAGSDVDGDTVSYQVTDNPRHGTLGGDAPSLTYMPEADYNGPDSLTFRVTDGDGTVSTPADVSITVTPVNDAPVALAQTVAVASGQAIDIVLEGTDVDGTVDGYEITVAPQHGALSGTAPMLKYTPELDFIDMDAFTFTVTDDAGATSGPAEVNIEVGCFGDRDVLVAFYQATNGDDWDENDGWLTSDDLARWHGVTAVDGCVVRIRLSRNGLVGTIPWQLGSLAFLGELKMRENDLAGPIPNELGMLTKLKVLDLYQNHLTGTIPWELGNLQSLEELYLNQNELSGAIPVELGQLTNIKQLYLSNNELTGGVPVELSSLANIEDLLLTANRLTGQVPKELAQLTRLRELFIDQNDLVGPIPPEFGNLPSILQLSLADNHLTGPVPEELGNLSSVLVLDLEFNELTGPIPPELANLPSVERLNLGRNRLSGGIPAEFGELASLEWLGLDRNELTGPIPPELARSTNLMWLSLHANQLAGPIPAVLGTLQNLRYLDLSDNQLTGSIPEELGELSSLAYLSLADNSLTGTIPLSLGQLPMDPSLVNGVLIGVSVHHGVFSGLLLSGNELSGPVPVELGNPTNAQTLLLDRNRLTGPLPAELTGLTRLIKFLFDENNGLCAPADTGFQHWLQGIREHQGPTCQ